MALKTFTLKEEWKGQQYQWSASAAEDAVRTFSSKLHQLLHITEWHRSLKGFKDEPGVLDSSISTMLFSKEFDPVPDQAAYEADVDALLARMDFALTSHNTGGQLKRADILALTPTAKELFWKHMPVRDCRVDREEQKAKDIASNQAHQEYEAERKQAFAEFAEVWMSSTEPIVIPEGMQAIYLSFNHDASDPMTDYYAPHAGVPDMQNLLLGWAPARAARTEKLARETLAKYPGILALKTFGDHGQSREADTPIKFDWFTQNYSMGHGNYLQSGVFMRLTTGKGKFEHEIGVHLEVEFAAGNYTKIYPIAERWKLLPQEA
jgi:hypothetical protein